MKNRRKTRGHFLNSFAPTQQVAEEGTHLNKKVDRKRSFGFLSILRTFLESITPHWLLEPGKDEEIDPNDYELQYFRWLEFSHHPNGKAIPKQSGYLIRVLHYGREGEHYTEITPCVAGIPQLDKVQKCGYEKLVFIAEVGDLYMRIMEIADHLGGEATMKTFDGFITMLPEHMETLRSHYQYKDLLKYWKARGRVLELMSATTMHQYQVVLRDFTVNERIALELERLGRASKRKANVYPFKRVA